MLNIFIGTDSAGGCSECNMVLEYSIKKNISGPYNIVRMMHNETDSNSTWYRWYTKNWSTPFSGYRYGIAEHMRNNNLGGAALYCDDDQLFLADPYEILENVIEPGKIMTGKLLTSGGRNEVRHCVSLIDVEKYLSSVMVNPSDMIEGAQAKTYPNYVNFCKNSSFPLTQIMSDEWNCFDGEDFDRSDIKLLHFTDMSSNPGVKLAIKRLGSQANHWYDGPIIKHRRPEIESIFYEYYEEALSAGYKVEDFVPENKLSVNKGSQKNYKANNGWS